MLRSKALLVAGTALLAFGEASSRNVVEEFHQFKARFGKSYTEKEEEERLKVFTSNLLFIDEENSKGHSYELDITEFADLSREEFRQQKACLSGSVPFSGAHLGTLQRSNKTLPSSVDWVKAGAVTPVKNQLQCGSCWAFSATGSTESAWYLATGVLANISEQQLLDCSSEEGNSGCNGGRVDQAFNYSMDHMLCSGDSNSYPYKAKVGICQTGHGAGLCLAVVHQGSFKGYHDVAADDIDALQEAVAQQPVSVAIEANQDVFQFYKSGVITKGCGTSPLDHSVVIVGYGTDAGVDYWIVRNSWGPAWGEHGYVRIERGLPGPGECGIKSQPSFPTVVPNLASSFVV